VTKPEQAKFVADLIDSVHSQIQEAFAADAIPADWNGIELRQYLADRFAAQAFKMIGQQLRSYKNTIATSSAL
jgi:hypothetical protein